MSKPLVVRLAMLDNEAALNVLEGHSCSRGVVHDGNMKWAADPSCYKTAVGSRNKSSTRRIKYLAPGSSWSCPEYRLRDRRGLRQAASAPCYIVAGAAARLTRP